MSDRFRDVVECEGFCRLSHIVLPNGTVAATSDWSLSGAMAKAALLLAGVAR